MRRAAAAAQHGRALRTTMTITGLLGALFVIYRGLKPRARDVKMGIGVGFFNLVALGATLNALSLFPGTLFFPLNGSAVVILANLCAQYIWRETQSRLGVIGVACGGVSMLLIFQ